jgi:hypothetical protein
MAKVNALRIKNLEENFIELKKFTTSAIIDLNIKSQEIIVLVKDSTKVLYNEIDKLKDQLDDFKSVVNKNISKNSSAKLVEEIKDFTHKISKCEKLIENSEAKVISLESVTNKLNLLATSRTSSRKRNIIIHGLKIQAQDDLLKSIQKFILKFLHVKPHILKVRKMKSNHLQNPPIIVTLSGLEDKAMVFGNCHKLKNCKFRVSITDDLNSQERKFCKEILLNNCKKMQNHFSHSNPEPVSRLKSQLKQDLDSAKPQFACKGTEEQIILDKKPVYDDSAQDCYINEIKQDVFICKCIKNFSKKIQLWNNNTTAFTGLVARIANRRRDGQHGCNCYVKETAKYYMDYIKTKALDIANVNLFLELLNQLRDVFKHRWNDCEDEKICYCTVISIEEMLLDKNFFLDFSTIPVKNETTDDNILAILF